MTGLLQLIKPQKTSSLFTKRCSSTQRTPPAFLDCHTDTLPIVIQHDGDNDGSAISGSLLLEVTEDKIEVESLNAVLVVHVAYKKPFKKSCQDCKHQFTELKRCELIESTVELSRGTHAYPLSYQVPSYVPPSMDTSMVSVAYEFEATASVRLAGQPSTPEVISFNRTLPVSRLIPIPDIQTCSKRIYQAAGVEINCTYDTVMNPSSKNKATLTLSGLRSSPGNGEEVHLWRVCSGTWILEEIVKASAPACPTHSSQDKSEGCREKQRRLILGDSTFFKGWTTDDDAGTMSMDFWFSTRKSSNHYTQDTGDLSDTSVSHTLVLELQMMKEIHPRRRPELATRQGIGKILRSEHRVVLSDHARLSDQVVEEPLPCYDGLRRAPPVYEEQ
ncbi:Endocytosis regulator [Fusarium irregulare]|uniref:Endocytosis regulator n=1 Tax=Fusarium irregulare TaxID=2494466 RepID=A0A9W8UAM1_9HYPO|nr:Endocytosis regulator [Fusarium irregulare]KAJ4026569.1 Endocytosis regulator [Fusarium irregulare]